MYVAGTHSFLTDFVLIVPLVFFVQDGHGWLWFRGRVPFGEKCLEAEGLNSGREVVVKLLCALPNGQPGRPPKPRACHSVESVWHQHMCSTYFSS